MSTFASPDLDELCNFIFEKCGLDKSITLIKNEIEDDLKAFNLDEDSEEHYEVYPKYGKTMYENYEAIVDKSFSFALDKMLTIEQKNLLLSFTLENFLEFRIVRHDNKGHEWSFDLFIPYVLNNLGKGGFTVHIFVDIPAYNLNYKLSSFTREDISESQLNNTLMMYKVQL